MANECEIKVDSKVLVNSPVNRVYSALAEVVKIDYTSNWPYFVKLPGWGVVQCGKRELTLVKDVNDEKQTDLRQGS